MRPLAVWGVFVRHLIAIRRTPLGQNDLWIWPFIDVLLMGSVGLFLTDSHDPLRVHGILAGVFLYTIIQGSSLSFSLLFMEETRSRNVLNLIASPATAVEYWFGTASAALVRVLIAGTASVLSSIAMYHFNPLTIGWAMPVVTLTMILIGFTMSTMLMALQLRLGGSAENATWVLAIVPAAISGAFVPISALPTWLQPIASALPTSHVFAAARSVVFEGGFPSHDLSVAWLGFAVMFATFAWLVKSFVAAFRRLGLVTRYS